MGKYICILVVLGLFQAGLALECYECNAPNEAECNNNQSVQKCAKPIAPDSVTACELRQSVGKYSKRCAIVKKNEAQPDCRLQKNTQGEELCSCTVDLCNKNAVLPPTPSPEPPSTPKPNSATKQNFSYFVLSGMILALFSYYC